MTIHSTPTGEAHMMRRSRAQENIKSDEAGKDTRRLLKGKDFGRRNKLFQKAKEGNREAMAEMAKIAPLTSRERKQIPV